MTTKSLNIPTPITPEQIEAWRDALDIDKGEACATIGKAPAFWSKFLSGEREIKLSELNILLKNFKIRAASLG
jgi:hypothetical protein